MTPTALRLRRLTWLFASAATVGLAGCFDDGDSSPPPPPPPPPVAADQVPPSAYASTDAFFAFALDQTSTANTVETSEPLMFDLVTGDPPSSETAEPTALP